MYRAILLAIMSGLGLTACNLVDSKSTKNESKDVTYSYTCLDSAVSGSSVNRAIGKTTGFIRDIAVSKKSITDEKENQYGDAFHRDAIESKTFKLVDDPAVTSQLQKVVDDLLAARENPSKLRYSVYLLDDKQINAFTFGGYIYLTKAMYEKIRSTPELLYSILGHEIGHSEKGHIKQTIQELELSGKLFGDNSMTYFQLKKLLAGSFNQKNELEADYYGIDLTYHLGKSLCSTVAFWRDMAKGENGYSRLEDFFRTHPFSGLRAQCLQDHIERNFDQNCSVK